MRFTVQPGFRVNYDKKDGLYNSVVTGTGSDGTRQPVLFTGPMQPIRGSSPSAACSPRSASSRSSATGTSATI